MTLLLKCKKAGCTFPWSVKATHLLFLTDIIPLVSHQKVVFCCLVHVELVENTGKAH